MADETDIPPGQQDSGEDRDLKAETSGQSGEGWNEGDGETSGGKNKNLKLQEKNRLAQRRFRERQKVRVNSLQQQIEELTDTVKKLTVTKHDLDTRNSLLESVLTVKDEQLRVMRERGHVMSQKIKEVGGANSGTITIYGPDHQQIAMVLASERLADDNRLLQALTEMYGVYMKKIQSQVKAIQEGDVTANQQLEQTLSSLFQQIDSVQAEGSSSFMKWLITSHDTHAQKFEGNSGWIEQLYDRIVQGISITPEQAYQLWDLYQTYLNNLKEMQQERVRVQAIADGNSSELTGIYSIKRATDFLQSQEAVAMYKDGLRRQQNVLFDLLRTVCRGVLSPFQTAQVLIASYPLMCDVIHLAKAAHKKFPRQDPNTLMGGLDPSMMLQMMPSI
mmetsp:Transcript_38400/g.108520  ORF Transcript_38400/g.108520 Transcript_38400/m.108520 type:complete len:390 (-) Transcript_38400:147-1316(-)|eukprot:CAMPEP_0117668800 /NCGR_PEP_ID=MMETSP0804-20121206/11760_1 /TAXON_ID=1074897 /ORGANISM="Tetraselmis astigmatica, Strain CCMP880" /LENGTH=389 /DNA_ID=CAMNT_0005476751 /DNA_START=574 /DNA_END=1743 /DNA_ORIENTATION=+